MNRLKQALDPVRAGDDLKTRTIVSLYASPKRKRFTGLRLAAALCGLVLCLGLLGGWLYLTPVSTLRIEINPALELEINRFDQVVSVKPLNQDGQRLTESLRLRFMTYTQALDLLLDSETIQVCLAEGKPMSIEVVCEDEQQADKMLAAVEDHTSSHENVHCHAGNASAQGATDEQKGHGYHHQGRHHG